MTALLHRLVRFFRDPTPRRPSPAHHLARLESARFDATRAAFERESG